MNSSLDAQQSSHGQYVYLLIADFIHDDHDSESWEGVFSTLERAQAAAMEKYGNHAWSDGECVMLIIYRVEVA